MQTRIKINEAIFILFVLLLGCGSLQIIVGVTFVPTLPQFQLDVVLRPDELQDEDVRNRALKSMQRAAENLSMFWTIAPGIFVSCTSGIGLYLLMRREFLERKKSGSAK